MQAWKVINKYMSLEWLKVTRKGRMRKVKKGMAGRKRYIKYKPKWCFRDVWSSTKHRTKISDIKHSNLKFTVQFGLYVPRVRTCHHLCYLRTLVSEKRAAWGSVLGCSLKYPHWHWSSFLIKVPGASVFKARNKKEYFSNLTLLFAK